MTLLDFIIIASSVIAPMYLYAEGMKNSGVIGKRKMIAVLAAWLFPTLLSMWFGTLQGVPAQVKMLTISMMCVLVMAFAFYTVLQIRVKTEILQNKHY